jgi:hypothetical protein
VPLHGYHEDQATEVRTMPSWGRLQLNLLRVTRDADERALRVLPYFNQHIRDGRGFKGHASFDVPAGGTRELQLTTGARAIYLERVIIAARGTDVEFTLIEAPAIATPGTTVVPFHNADRRSSRTSSFVGRLNPAGVSGGTVIERSRLFGFGRTGGPAHAERSGDRHVSGFEGILRPMTEYVRRIVNHDDRPVPVHLEASWYELTD